MAVPQAADPAELSTDAIAWLLASGMRQELLAFMREVFQRPAFACQLGSVKAGRRRLISKHHLDAFLAGDT